MPLDAADFIAELDINSPPGTDPLNQGDDQIRTAKRTQLNSFPLIGGAVSIDHNQMNQMAIKNEANTFSGINTFTNSVTHENTVLNLNRITNGDLPLQYQRNGFTRWSVAMFEDSPGFDNDFVIQRRDSVGTLLSNPIVINAANGTIRASSGTAAEPQYSFQSTIDAGFFRLPSGIGVATSGLQRWAFGDTEQLCSTRLTMNEKIRFNNFNSNHGITWRANGALTWELIAVHSNAPLTRLTFDRYVANVFQDQPLQLHNDTGHVNMPVLPTTEPAGVPGSLYTQLTSQIDATERVICCSR